MAINDLYTRTVPETLTIDGKSAKVERVRIADLPEWCRDHGLEPIDRKPPRLVMDGEALDVWPPIVLYRNSVQETTVTEASP